MSSCFRKFDLSGLYLEYLQRVWYWDGSVNEYWMRDLQRIGSWVYFVRGKLHSTNKWNHLKKEWGDFYFSTMDNEQKQLLTIDNLVQRKVTEIDLSENKYEKLN